MVVDQTDVLSASCPPKPSILALILDFDVWELACKWSYANSYALIDGLKAFGCDVLVLPSLCLQADPKSNPWLEAHRQIIGEKSFDQVWIWTTHCHYNPEMWQWIRSIAPIRVGVNMESLTYIASDIAETPRLAARKEQVYLQLQHMTHVITGDEADLLAIASELRLPTHHYFPMLPQSFVIDATRPIHDCAVFLGTVYGKREIFFKGLRAGDNLRSVTPPEDGTDLPAKFDHINADSLEQIRGGLASAALANSYVEAITAIRIDVVRRTLAMYNRCLAGVSLPAIYQGVTGRIVEMMAASSAVLLPKSEMPLRAGTLLRDGHNVLCYDGNDPRDLQRQARRLKDEAGLRDHLVGNAKSAFETRLSSEVQIDVILSWVGNTLSPTGV